MKGWFIFKIIVFVLSLLLFIAGAAAIITALIVLSYDPSDIVTVNFVYFIGIVGLAAAFLFSLIHFIVGRRFPRNLLGKVWLIINGCATLSSIVYFLYMLANAAKSA